MHDVADRRACRVSLEVESHDAVVAQEQGRADVTIETEDQVLGAHVGADELVTIDMGVPRLRWDEIPLAEEFHDTRRIELQEEKKSLIRAIKEIEFDRDLGKMYIGTQGHIKPPADAKKLSFTQSYSKHRRYLARIKLNRKHQLTMHMDFGARTSMLSRSGAPCGLVGSSKALCGVKRATAPSLS